MASQLTKFCRLKYEELPALDFSLRAAESDDGGGGDDARNSIRRIKQLAREKENFWDECQKIYEARSPAMRQPCNSGPTMQKDTAPQDVSTLDEASTENVPAANEWQPSRSHESTQIARSAPLNGIEHSLWPHYPTMEEHAATENDSIIHAVTDQTSAPLDGTEHNLWTRYPTLKTNTAAENNSITHAPWNPTAVGDAMEVATAVGSQMTPSDWNMYQPSLCQSVATHVDRDPRTMDDGPIYAAEGPGLPSTAPTSQTGCPVLA